MKLVGTYPGKYVVLVSIIAGLTAVSAGASFAQSNSYQSQISDLRSSTTQTRETAIKELVRLENYSTDLFKEITQMMDNSDNEKQVRLDARTVLLLKTLRNVSFITDNLKEGDDPSTLAEIEFGDLDIDLSKAEDFIGVEELVNEDKLVNTLETGTDAGKTVSCEMLSLAGKFGHPVRESVPQLLDLLNSRDSVLKASAAQAIGYNAESSSDVRRALQQTLRDRSREVKLRAAIALLRLFEYDDEAMATIIRRANKADTHFRDVTLTNIRAVNPGTNEFYTGFFETINGKTLTTHRSFWTILNDYPNRSSGVFLEMYLNDNLKLNDFKLEFARSSTFAFLSNLKEKLRATLRNGSMGSRRKALTLTAKIGPAADDLVEPVADHLANKRLRRHAAKALGRIGRPAIDGLKRRLENAGTEEKRGILMAFKELGEVAREHVPLLVTYLSDEKTAPFAKKALRKVGRSALPYLISQSLNDSDTRVRVQSREVIVSYGETAVPYLIDSLKTDDRISDIFEILETVKRENEPAFESLKNKVDGIEDRQRRTEIKNAIKRMES